MKRSRLSRAICAAALAVLVPATLALAACGSDTAPTDLPTRTTPVPAVSFPPQDYRAGHHRMGNDAFAFVPWVDIEVTGLGYYDHDGDGLVTEHMVGIFEESSKELVAPAVSIDNESELKGSFRYEPIAPVVLKAGTHYIVAGQTEPPYDPTVENPHDLVWAPEIRFLECRMRVGEFRFPFESNSRYITASFLFRTPASTSPSPAP